MWPFTYFSGLRALAYVERRKHFIKDSLIALENNNLDESNHFLFRFISALDSLTIEQQVKLYQSKLCKEYKITTTFPAQGKNRKLCLIISWKILYRLSNLESERKRAIVHTK